MNSGLTQNSDIEELENYIAEYIKKNGVMPNRKEILKHFKIGEYKLSTVISASKNVHLVVPGSNKITRIKVNGWVLDSILEYYRNNQIQGEYLDKFIDALEESISYDRFIS